MASTTAGSAVCFSTANWACVSLMASAHFPKFVLHRRTHLHELRKVMGTSRLMILVPLFDLKSLGQTRGGAVQGLQIGGTSTRWDDGTLSASLFWPVALN